MVFYPELAQAIVYWIYIHVRYICAWL